MKSTMQYAAQSLTDNLVRNDFRRDYLRGGDLTEVAWRCPKVFSKLRRKIECVAVSYFLGNFFNAKVFFKQQAYCGTHSQPNKHTMRRCVEIGMKQPVQMRRRTPIVVRHILKGEFFCNILVQERYESQDFLR